MKILKIISNLFYNFKIYKRIIEKRIQMYNLIELIVKNFLFYKQENVIINYLQIFLFKHLFLYIVYVSHLSNIEI